MKNGKHVEQMDVRFFFDVKSLIYMCRAMPYRRNKNREKNQHEIGGEIHVCGVHFTSKVRRKKKTFCLRLKFYY